MAAGTDDDSSFMDKIIKSIKGSKESIPNRIDPSQKKVRFSIWYFIAAILALIWFQGYTGGSNNPNGPW
jgi:hypothetical protein